MRTILIIFMLTGLTTHSQAAEPKVESLEPPLAIEKLIHDLDSFTFEGSETDCTVKALYNIGERLLTVWIEEDEEKVVELRLSKSTRPTARYSVSTVEKGDVFHREYRTPGGNTVTLQSLSDAGTKVTIKKGDTSVVCEVLH